MRRPVVLTAPWVRGPALTAREPLVLVAVVAAALLLGLVAAGGPLFVSSVGAGALHVAADGRCAQDDQVTVVNPALNVFLPVVAGPQPPATVAAADPAVRAAMAEQGRLRSSTLDVDVLATAPVFPGMRHPGQPVLVVDLAALGGFDRYAGWSSELWTDQRHAPAVLDALSARGVLTDDVAQPEAFVDATSLLPVTWTFDFLRALSALVAALSLAGLVLFIAARQQREENAYVMMRRMGMTARSHRRSVLLEVGAVSGWAWSVGTLAGAAALAIAVTRIDVDPAFPPPTLLVLPLAGSVITALALAAATLALSWWTTHRAERVHPAVVLRR